MVSDDIAAVTKVDKPFPKLLGKVLEHPAEAGMRAKYLNALSDRLTGPKRGISALRTQEIPQPLQIPDRRRGEYYLRHPGAGSSCSVPQLASH